MKKVLIALLCMATIALMISCSKSKTDMVVDGFEELVEEVEKKKGNLTVEEWNKMEEEFNNRTWQKILAAAMVFGGVIIVSFSKSAER